MERKIVYLEYLRVFCAITVIIDHICISAIHNFDSLATNYDRFLYNGVQHWSHFAVPVFVMITGFLLLNPQKEISLTKAIKKYAWRMVAVLLVVGTAFAWLELFFSSKRFIVSDIFVSFLNMFEGHSWNHLWYLYMLIGLYLITPMLKYMVNTISVRELDLFIGIGLFFTSLWPLIKNLLNIEIGIDFPISSVYVFYMLLGYRLGNVSFKKRSLTLFYAIAILLSVLCFLLAYLEFMGGYDELTVLTKYYSPVIVGFAIMVFLIFKMHDPQYLSRQLAALSRDSFGIYVFHMLFINVLYKAFNISPVVYGVWTIIPITLIVLLLSEITTIIYRRIPVIGKYI